MSVSGRAVVSSGEYEGRFHRNLLFAFLKKGLYRAHVTPENLGKTHPPPHTHARSEK